MKRLVLVLLTLWTCAGLLHLLLEEESARPSTLLDEGKQDPEGIGGSAAGGRAGFADVRLSARELPGTSASEEEPNRTPEPLPAWLQDVRGVTDGPVCDRFVSWVREDPRRLLDFVWAQRGRDHPTPRPPEQVYCDAAADIGSRAALLAFAGPTLLEVLRQPAQDWSRVAAVFGLMSQMALAFRPEEEQALWTLAGRSDAPRDARLLAGLLALGRPGSAEKKNATWLAAMSEDGQINVGRPARMLDRLADMGTEARAFLPSLLALQNRPYSIWGSRAATLGALMAMAGDDPRVVDLMLGALGEFGSTAELVRRRLFEGVPGDSERVLALLATANGTARVNGVRYLLETGVPPAQVGHLLVPALDDPSAWVRTNAVTLLVRAELSVEAVVPAIQRLFASKDEARWLTATEALGALSRMSGDLGSVVDLLFTAVRMPNKKVRTSAVQTLLMFEGENARIIPLLADLLRDGDADVRREAVDGLGELSAHDEEARSQLQAALGDADESVREVVQYWLEEEDEADEGD